MPEARNFAPSQAFSNGYLHRLTPWVFGTKQEARAWADAYTRTCGLYCGGAMAVPDPVNVPVIEPMKVPNEERTQ